MTRRRRLAVSLLALLVLGPFSLGLAAPHTAHPAGAAELARQQRPNIVLIVADDMRTDDLAAMPFARRFFDTRWTDYYATNPLCCPSRSTMLTGQYSHNHHVVDNEGPHGGYPAFRAGRQSHALPTWLDTRYRTVMVGKYLNLYGPGTTRLGNTPAGWDHWAAMWTNTYVYRAGGYTINVNGRAVRPDRYQTNALTDIAVRQLHQPGARPTFEYIAYPAPHHSNWDGHRRILAAPKYRGDSRVGVPRSAAYDEPRIGDKPAWLRRAFPDRISRAERRDIVILRRQRRDALRSVDDGVKRIVHTLRRQGELGDTLILFTSDNGYMFGEHRIPEGKRLPYLPSARLPLLGHGPGLAAGVRHKVAGNIDLAPTIADAANVRPRLMQDGVSLLGPVRRKVLLVESQHGHDFVPPSRSVVGPRLVYTEWAGGAVELYDLARDPAETRDVSSLPRYRADGHRLARQLGRLDHCKGRTCR